MSIAYGLNFITLTSQLMELMVYKLQIQRRKIMKLIRNIGKFEILTSEKDLKNDLLKIERAGRTCYQSEKSEITEESAEKFIKMLIRNGHESVLEHSYLSVRFHLSRGGTHELVRHRLNAVSQESTRYVDYAEKGDTGPNLEKFQIKFVSPPHQNKGQLIELEDGTAVTPARMFEVYEMFYRGLRKAGWPPEDARQLLPIGLYSEIVISANLRQWRHIFDMRTAKGAHWEIRVAMTRLLKKLKEIIPVMFEDFIETGTDNNKVAYFKKQSLTN